MLTHGNLMANVAQINAWLPQVRYSGERLMGLLAVFPLLRAHRLSQLAHVPGGHDYRAAPL